MLHYYEKLGGTIVLDDSNPDFLAPDPSWVEVTQAQYQLSVLAIWQSLGYDQLNLYVSRSKSRVDAYLLQDAAIDTGKSYAVYLPDLSELGVTQVDFDLDGVFHHSEVGGPWDYDGTDGFGFANRVVFTPGTHTIDAHVTYGGGTFTVSAEFEVD